MILNNLLESKKAAFTLVELLVVIAMIAIIIGAMSLSVRAAQERARVQKATSDVKVISQALLASENYAQGYKLEPIGGTSPTDGADADATTLRSILGLGDAAPSGGKIPALLMASLQGGGRMLDPWGTPYKIQIKKGVAEVKFSSNGSSTYFTGYTLPNFYRLSEEERQ